MSIVSLDLETTGLDERIHEAWEVALVDDMGGVHCWQFPLRKRFMDTSPEALNIGGFHERYVVERGWCVTPFAASRYDPELVAEIIAKRLEGVTLMGCAIQFDMRFLAELLRAYDVEPTWHHRALDLGSYAAGVFDKPEPMSSKTMQEIVPNHDAHTALGDARWNWQMYHYLRTEQELLYARAG